MNWDAGHGKWLLKPFFKDTAITCQQQNKDVFVTQLAARAQHQGREIIAIVPLENGAFCTIFSENFHKF
jgi:hypothetical protein